MLHRGLFNRPTEGLWKTDLKVQVRVNREGVERRLYVETCRRPGRV